jgi:hypothetical protein
MILNLSELRNEFENLKNIRVDIKNYFENLSNKIQLLTGIYSKYIKQQENSGNILFGLDALHFQTFLINFEYDSMKKLHILIENKLYCEYYKLFKLIINYVKQNIDDINILKVCEHKSKYPIYKDLEQYRVYDFELINEIHDDILLILELMSKFVLKKEKELELDEDNTNNGLNLHIVVNTIDFNITLLKQNLKLYTSYLKIFHKYHTTYLSRLSIKIGIMWGQVNKDINIERSMSTAQINDDERKSKIKSCPSLTNIQQEEIISYIETNNSSVKDELNEIMIHISDDSDNDLNVVNDETEYMIEENHNNEQICEVVEHNINLVINDISETIDKNINSNIDINIICHNTRENMNDIFSSDDDVGSITGNKLKERWDMVVNQSQMTIEDMASKLEINGITDYIVDELVEEEDNTDINNDRAELNKWREIISNNGLSQEEKEREKARLKRIRYRNNKKKEKS